MLKIKRIQVLILALLTIVMLIGCGKKQSGEQESKYITIKGSDTMVHLVSSWAEAYMKIHPDVQISVTGGGSGTGIAALLNGTTDICAASRKIKDKEIKLANEKNITPIELVVGTDGLAVVLHKDNPVSALTLEQLRKVFNGSYQSWKQVNGKNEDILVLSRESNSGTYVFFQSNVLKKDDYSEKALLMPASSAIIQSVMEDKTAIGYVGLGYALDAGDKIKILKVKTEDSEVAPSQETVAAGQYPIARPLHFYTNGQAKGKIKEFIDYCLSAEGQKIVTETGYIPIK